MVGEEKKKRICFCAFCRTPHRIYRRKGIGWTHVMASLLLTLCFMWGVWTSWKAEAIPLFLICLILGELVAHFKWRLALICRQCGFDPLIYQKNPERAANKVRAFLIRRKTEPQFLLAPAIQLPKRRIVSEGG